MKEALIDNLAILLYPLLRHEYSQSQLTSLLHNIQSLSLRHRKQLITMCRSGSIPRPDTSLFGKCSETIFLLSEDPKWHFDHLERLIGSPLHSGLLIALSISMPLTDNAVSQTYVDLLAKEMMVMESSPLQSALNYNVFFGSYAEPIHPTIPPNPKQAATIHQLIDMWVLSIESKPYILPHMTGKLCSKDTQKEVAAKYPGYHTFEEEGATQPDLEYLYMKFGDKLEGGSCEVKQRWYTSQLVPRTYYAAGSDAYHKSKYVRDALNSLCDHLPPTERYSRVNPHRIVLSSIHSHALIYDLTSFTSNMHEQRHFMDRLAWYCRGRTVRVLDAVEGVVPVDLGILLSEYNDLNTEPAYSSDKLLGNGLVLSHHVAGFLGVYGNLASCTFLHGAVMSQLVHSFSQLGVAGDDGLVESEDDWTTFFMIRLLGLMEESKGYNTLEPGNQIYLKRPIRQVGRRLFSETFALYSMIEHLFDEDDHRFFTQPRSKSDRLSSLASSIVAYLRSVSKLVLTADEKDMAFAFLTNVYSHAGFPIQGQIPQIHTPHSPNQRRLPSVVVPTLNLDVIGNDPIEYTINSLYSGCAVLPSRTDERIELDYDLLFAGSEFVCTGSPLLSYYRKLGFVELMQDDIVVLGEDGLHLLLKHYSLIRDYPVYTVTVLADIPLHLQP